MKKIAPLLYGKNWVKIVDQRKLPLKACYVNCRNQKDIFDAIAMMKIRGAPAIGIAAAFGVWLAGRNCAAANKKVFFATVEKAIDYLAKSRPTAVNLFWALEAMRKELHRCAHEPIPRIKQALYAKAVALLKDDQKRSLSMGSFGARLIKNGDHCLTICNAGGMATSGYGTALAVFFKAKETGKRFEVFACETRPLLQGARITTWELSQAAIKTTLICDSMAATLMKQGRIQKIFVGADRITMSGDFANKIGTYNLAVLARVHKVPFYVVAPLSTFDKKLKNGAQIPIEFRDPREVTRLYFKKPSAPSGIGVFNPAFDVTPAGLVSAFITEKGIVQVPFSAKMRAYLDAAPGKSKK